MLEVVFSDSTKGSMKMAKNYYKEKMFDKNLHDVAFIGYALDIGDILSGFDSIKRQVFFQKICSQFNFRIDEQEQFFQNQRIDMGKLLKAANNGTPIRIWVSDSPYTICGFHFICHMLKDVDCELSVVHLPKYVQISEEKIISYSDWAEIEPNKFNKFLYLEKHISPLEKQIYSSHWYNLMNENALLRAVVNGELISVPENFYDHIIIDNIPDEDFIMASLIGTVLGKHKLGLNDCWVALRIERMIEEQKLIIIGDKGKSYSYGKILRKTQM